jgi:hypothetical protein
LRWKRERCDAASFRTESALTDGAVRFEQSRSTDECLVALGGPECLGRAGDLDRPRDPVLTARLDTDKARRARQVGLSLAFIFRVIMLVGLTWLMGLTLHIPRGYIYFAMAFAGAVEAFNVMAKRKRRRL